MVVRIKWDYLLKVLRILPSNSKHPINIVIVNIIFLIGALKTQDIIIKNKLLLKCWKEKFWRAGIMHISLEIVYMILWYYLFLYVSAFSPRWNETFTFVIQVPELALIRFVVENQNFLTGNEFLGQYTLPVLCMSKGNIFKSKMIVLTFKCNLSLPKTNFDRTNSSIHDSHVKGILCVDIHVFSQ